MSRPVYLIWKVGGPKDMLLVNYYDPEQMKHNEQQEAAHFSEHMKKVYRIQRIPRSWNYKDWAKPLGKYVYMQDDTAISYIDKSDPSYRRSRGLFDKEAFKNIVGDPQLFDKWYSGQSYPIIDSESLGLQESIIKDSSKVEIINPGELPDVNAYTSGDWGIGSGDDYSDVDSYAEDMGTLDGHATGTLSSNTTENTQVDFDANNGGYNNSVLTDSPHGGDVTAGHIITLNDAGASIIDMDSAGGGYIIFNGLHFEAGENPSSLIPMIEMGDKSKILHCYIDGKGYQNTYGIFMNDAAGEMIVASNLIWDSSRAIYVARDLAASHGIDNNTAYLCPVYGIYALGKSGTLRNTIAFESTTTLDDFSSTTTMTRNNLASSDNSAGGTDPQPNLTSADEIYLTDTQSTFGKPKDAQTVYQNGSTTHLESTDLAGNTWDGSDPSIGAFQFQAAAGGPPVGTLSMMGVGR